MRNPPLDNLFLKLHKFASHQDENFTTEVFVHLLRHLQIVEPNNASSLIHFLTGGLVMPTVPDCSNFKITTQKAFMEGRPDILIAGLNHFVIIEVKVESRPGWDQLERYRELLKGRSEPNRCLVLLSRYPPSQPEAEKVDCAIQWYRLVRVLERVREQLNEPVCRYLIQQFVEFFTERGIAVEKVGWELARGIQSLLSLMDMLDDAVNAAKLRTKPRTAGVEFNGRYFYVDDVECWAGLYYPNPEIVVVEAYGLKNPTEKTLTSGRIERARKNTFKWVNELNLASENVHFFALTPDNQQARLQEFISNSIAAVRKMCRAS